MSAEIDARGLPCPQPVFAVKKALAGMVNGVVTIIVDNEAAKENVSKFAIANRCGVCVEKMGGDYFVRISKGLIVADDGQAKEAVLPPDKSIAGERVALSQSVKSMATAYLITRDSLGEGERELGMILIKSLFFALAEKNPPPVLVFMNGGINLTIDGSPILKQLRDLAAGGAKILSCGTCLEYYKARDKLAVGEITNMYTAIEELEKHRVITI